jgi:hypothetical protein
MVQWRMHMYARAGKRPVSFRRAHAVGLMGVLALGVAALVGCSQTTYAQTIRISAETMNAGGLFARVEYLKDGDVANSVHLVDGDGDGIIDGKSGPKSVGNWPVGWQWFDEMYADAIVGQTTISFDSQKVVVDAEKTYEFIVGEYEVRAAS